MGDKTYDNFDDLLNDMQKEVSALDGKYLLGDILSDKFMRTNTKFSNMDEMFEKLNVSTEDELDAIPDEEFNNFIAGHTSFKTWKEMLETAAVELYANKLNH